MPQGDFSLFSWAIFLWLFGIRWVFWAGRLHAAGAENAWVNFVQLNGSMSRGVKKKNHWWNLWCGVRFKDFFMWRLVNVINFFLYRELKSHFFGVLIFLIRFVYNITHEFFSRNVCLERSTHETCSYARLLTMRKEF